MTEPLPTVVPFVPLSLPFGGWVVSFRGIIAGGQLDQQNGHVREWVGMGKEQPSNS